MLEHCLSNIPAVVTGVCNTGAAAVDLTCLPRNPDNRTVGFVFAQKSSDLT